MRLPWFVLVLVSLTTGAQQTELSPGRIAEIQLAEERALAAVEATFGNKPPSELTPEQRRALIRARAAASADVLRQQGIDAKAYARRTATLSRAEQQQVAEARAELPSAPRREENDVELIRGGDPMEAGGATPDPIEVVTGADAEAEAPPAATRGKKSPR